ncbi:MAG: serine hydrolase [Saprospiraceae bacterium]|nr:serine hydrolase [Saprospiraceae bacterium]
MKQFLLSAFILIFGSCFQVAFGQDKVVDLPMDQFDKILSEHFKPNETGATVLVSKKGQVIYHKAFGMANLELNVPMHTDHVFWLASIGKQFTAVAILQLIEKGKLELHDEITRFIPDYPTQGNRITIEHLLTHTSGIHNYSGIKDPEKKLAVDCKPEEVIDFFKNLPMRFAPGTKWEYSNSGYFLLGYIIEKISGKKYAEYLDENIFKPLGMANTHFANNKRIINNRVGAYSMGNQGYENSRYLNETIIFSAGAIQTTVSDFFKWHEAVHSYKLVRKETMDKAFNRYKLSDGQEVDYGYGWRLGYLYDRPSIWHGGMIEGYGTMELHLPKDDVFIVILTNCDCTYPKDIVRRLAALTIGKPYQYEEIIIDKKVLSHYSGLYENQMGRQHLITVIENQLYFHSGRGPKFQLKPYQIDKFYFADDLMETIEFDRNHQGEIVSFTLQKLTGNESFLKTNKPIPDENGIKLEEKILASYEGDYEIPSAFTFKVVRDESRIFIKVVGQDPFEIYAQTENKFFAKVEDAQFEFMKDSAGKITKVILNQGGRQIEAIKLNEQ